MADLDFAGDKPVHLATVDITLYLRSNFNRQRRRFFNTRRVLCVEPADRFLLVLEWQELAAG